MTACHTMMLSGMGEAMMPSGGSSWILIELSINMGRISLWTVLPLEISHETSSTGSRHDSRRNRGVGKGIKKAGTSKISRRPLFLKGNSSWVQVPQSALLVIS